MTVARLSLTCGVLAGSSSAAVAGAWTLEKGSGQVIVSGLYSTASSIFGDHGSDLRPIDFDKVTGSIFAEYGLADGLTLVGEGEFGLEEFGGSSRSSIARVGLGARSRLYRSGGFVLSGQAMARIERNDARPARRISMDVGRPELEARALAGYGFTLAGKQAFVDAQAAYRFRLADGPDEASFDLTLGFRPIESLLLLVQSASTISVGTDRDGESYHYHKLGGSAVYDLNESLAVQVGGFATVAGRNALRERGAVSAVWYRF